MGVEEERGPGPGSRGAVIKADSAVIFTAHCITALPCCIPHAAQLLEWSEKFGATAQLAEEEERGAQSLKQEGHTGLGAAH